MSVSNAGHAINTETANTVSSNRHITGALRRLPAALLLILTAAIVASCYSWLLLITTFWHPGAIGANYNAVGSDYMVFHGAAQSYFQGHLATIFDGDRFTSFLNQSYGFWLSEKLPFRPWVYPPSFLLLVLPFSVLNFLTSYCVFQVVTAAGLIAALTIGRGHDKLSLRIIATSAIVCPAAAINVVDGQNAFLVAALLISGVGLLERKPLLAGALLGAVTIKPQFAFLLPAGLIAAHHWRALLGAFTSVFGLTLLSAILFGWHSWGIWLQQTVGSLGSPDPKWIEYGRMWGNSVWTCAVLVGASPRLASVMQLLSVVVSAAAVFMTFRRTKNANARLVILLSATLLAAPHWSPYDAIMIALAGALWLKQQSDLRVAVWRWTIMLALWIIPLVSPPVLIPVSRLFPMLLLGFIAIAMRPLLVDFRPTTQRI